MSEQTKSKLIPLKISITINVNGVSIVKKYNADVRDENVSREYSRAFRECSDDILKWSLKQKEENKKALLCNLIPVINKEINEYFSVNYAEHLQRVSTVKAESILISGKVRTKKLFTVIVGGKPIQTDITSAELHRLIKGLPVHGKTPQGQGANANAVYTLAVKKYGKENITYRVKE